MGSLEMSYNSLWGDRRCPITIFGEPKATLKQSIGKLEPPYNHLWGTWSQPVTIYREPRAAP